MPFLSLPGYYRCYVIESIKISAAAGVLVGLVFILVGPVLVAENDGGGVEQHDRRARAGRRSQVARAPERAELVLVGVQALEIIKLLPVTVDQRADLMPERGEGVALQPRERRHAEIEPAVTLLLRPEHEFEEQEFHRPDRRIGGVAHQVDADLLLALQ